MMRTTSQIALGLFLINKDNRIAFEESLREINQCLTSLDPSLSEKERVELLLH